MLRPIFHTLRFLWHKCVPKFIKIPLYPHINSFIELKTDWELKRIYKFELGKKNLTDIQPGSLILSGFFEEALGIGRGGHSSFEALRRAGLDPQMHNIRSTINSPDRFSQNLPGDSRGGVYFMHCNPPEIIAALRKLNPDSYSHKYRIGYWAYELPKVPEKWMKLGSFFNEIWVPSQFVKDSLQGIECPIRVMPHDVISVMESVKANREIFGLNDDKFIIFSAVDLRSSATRKNLQGVIDIYLRAYPEESSKVQLILKITGINSGHKHTRKKLYAKIDGRRDITIVSENLPYSDMLSLIKSTDLLLSPHRSEGFGLVIAESLALGVNVLATGWSGNMEFMAPLSDALLPYELIPVKDPHGVYNNQEKQVWADVDIVLSAKKLKAYVDNVVPDYRGQALAELQKIGERWSYDELKSMEFFQFLNGE